MIRFTKRLLKTALLLILISALLIGYAYTVEPHRLQTSDVSVSSENSPKFTIFQFGDTHFGFSYSLSDFEKVIESVNEENPDVIIFTGDLIDDLNTYEGDISEIEEALSKLNSVYGKFAVYGNHDFTLSGEALYEEIMEEAGFTVLTNEYIFIEELNTVIYGTDDFLIGSGDSAIVDGANADYFNILVCHEPDLFDDFSQNNISLMLSGHTHGGQISLPLGITDKFLPSYGKKYVSGLYEKNGSSLYVTSGLGTTKLPLRFNAPPEIVYLRIGG